MEHGPPRGPITSRIPQGSILFNIFIIDLEEGSQVCSYYQIRRSSRYTQVQGHLERDLHRLEEWASRDLAKLNEN